MIVHCSFNLHFLVINEVEYLFIFGHLGFVFCEVPIKSFTYFSIVLSYMQNIFYFLHSSPLSVLLYVLQLSYSVSSLFSFFALACLILQAEVIHVNVVEHHFSLWLMFSVFYL